MTLRRKQQCSAILLKTRLGECYLTVFFDVDSIAVGFRILSDRPRSHPVQYYSFFTFVGFYQLLCCYFGCSCIMVILVY